LNKLQRLTEICHESSIALMYLFGSMKDAGLVVLQGHSVAQSDPLADIDVGVVFAGSLPHGLPRTRLYSRIYNRLEDLFLPYKLDLVLLQETHSVFQAEAVMGHCLYYIDDAFKDNYEEDTLRRACDFRPYLEQYHKEVLEAFRSND